MDEFGRQVTGEALERLRSVMRGMLAWQHDSFPGSQCVSFDHAKAKKVRNEWYYACEKSDGVRAMMLIGMSPGEEEERGEGRGGVNVRIAMLFPPVVSDGYPPSQCSPGRPGVPC